MRLSEKQAEFARNIGRLITWAFENGYSLTFGDGYRAPSLHGDFGEKKAYGAAHSVHKLRLAVDFNLFIDGEYQTSTEAHRPLGEYWKSLHPLARWGGDFPGGDGNHYSFEHEGYS